MLNIYEVDYSVSPGGINMFEILLNDELVYDTPNFIDAMEYAYKSGFNFTVHTLEAYHIEFEEAYLNPATGVSGLTNVSTN